MMRPILESEVVRNQGDVGHGEKVFNDAVHGHIALHPLCVKVIDTPQFQRLRFLKQLGPCYFVFPAAAHNRFEHSLGVCHLAGQLVRSLQLRQPELNITEKDVLCVQLAGLCHDLGHGPFSHLWEMFVKRVRPGKKWKHEEASIRMFDYLLEKNDLYEEFCKYNLDSQDIIFVKELILGSKKVVGRDWPNEGRPREKAFLYEIVANKRSGVDVDKWDYFMRDGYSMGIKVTFDYHRLVEFCRVIDVEGEGTQICYRDKEASTLHDMFRTRYCLHKTAYQHRVVKTLDSMIVDAFVYADKHIKYSGSNGKKYYLGDVCDDMSAYSYLVDDIYNQIQRAEGDDPELMKAKQIIQKINNRHLYASVGQSQPTSSNIDKASLMEALANSIPQDSSLTIDELDMQVVQLSYGMGAKNPIDCVRFYSKEEPDVGKVLSSENISMMLPQRYQEAVFRLVIKTVDENSFRHAEEAFRAACSQLKMEEPSVRPWPSHLAPVTSKNGIFDGWTPKFCWHWFRYFYEEDLPDS